MPELIGTALVSAVAGAEVASTVLVSAGTVSLTVGQVVGQVVVTAALAGASYALQSRQGGSSAPQKSTLRQASPYRFFVFGRARVAGYWALYEAKNGYFQGVLLNGEGPIDAVEAYFSGAELIRLNVSNQAISGHLTTIGLFKSFLGSADQTRTGTLITDFPTGWNTTDHRLRGIACTEVKIFRPADADVIAQLPGGVPQDLRRQVRGQLVDDPRGTAGQRWSQNPAEILLWYLRQERGARIPLEWLDVDSFALEADACDELVPKFGGWEPRYQLNGTASMGEEPRAIIARMLATMDGELHFDGEGRVMLRTGRWEEPLVTLTEADIIEIQFETGSSHGDGFERVSYRWTAPEADYSMTSGPVVELAERRTPLAAPLTTNLDFELVTSGSQAWRLAERFANRSWAESHLIVTCGARGLLCLDQSVVRIQETLYGIDRVYKIQKFTENWRTNEVTLELSEITEDMFVETIPPEIPIERQTSSPSVYNAQSAGIVPKPAWISARHQVVPGGAILVIESAPETTTLTGLTFEAQYRAAGATDWETALTGGGRSPWQAETGFITLGTTYEVRGRFVTPEGLVSYVSSGGDVQQWPPLVSLPTNATEAAPAAPSGRSDVDDGLGNTTVSWTQATSTGFQFTEVRTNLADDYSTATVLTRVLGSGAQFLVVTTGTFVFLRSFTSAGAGSTY